MAYQRKTKDIWHLMANYGYGWEIECSYENRAEAKADIKEYRASGAGGNYYLKKAREKIGEVK